MFPILTRRELLRTSALGFGSLAFAPDGTLWGSTWPNRGKVVQFNHVGKAVVMLSYDTPVGSIAFGCRHHARV